MIVCHGIIYDKSGYPTRTNQAPYNKQESLKRLDDLMRKLEKQAGMLQKYDDIIQD